jgi:hypothetical protein
MTVPAERSRDSETNRSKQNNHDFVLGSLSDMIRLRHQQPSLWETFFAQEVDELWEPWMRVADELLEDDELLDSVYDAQD